MILKESSVDIYDSRGRRFVGSISKFDLIHKKYSSLKSSSRVMIEKLDNSYFFQFIGAPLIRVNQVRSLEDINEDIRDLRLRIDSLERERDAFIDRIPR